MSEVLVLYIVFKCTCVFYTHPPRLIKNIQQSYLDTSEIKSFTNSESAEFLRPKKLQELIFRQKAFPERRPVFFPLA
jgi:hypothetical protein